MQIQAFPDELFPFNEIQDEAILEAFPNETQDEQTHELLPFNGTQEDEISVSTVTNLRNGDLGFDPYEEVGKKVDMSLFDKFENVQLKIDRATVDLNYSFEIKKETIACTTCAAGIQASTQRSVFCMSCEHIKANVQVAISKNQISIIFLNLEKVFVDTWFKYKTKPRIRR